MEAENFFYSVEFLQYQSPCLPTATNRLSSLVHRLHIRQHLQFVATSSQVQMILMTSWKNKSTSQVNVYDINGFNHQRAACHRELWEVSAAWLLITDRIIHQLQWRLLGRCSGNRPGHWPERKEMSGSVQSVTPALICKEKQRKCVGVTLKSLI